MKYTDLIENYGFKRNMQETNWLKLFPHWWSENDPLLETIGKEVAFLKAQGIFTLLNTMVKPPVMIWQNSVVEKEYIISETFTDFTDAIIENEAPLYKTYGHIKFISYSDENIQNLRVAFTDNDYIIIKTIIKPQDNVIINIGNQKVTINGKKADVQVFGEGISYFKTQQQEKDISKWNSQEYYFSNEILRISFGSDANYDVVNFDVEIVLDNVVFINEQNIEITGLELVPIKSMELYVYYDFPFNQKVNGWQKASEKKYIEDTNVIYDMITTKFNTKKFYVDVWYKGLDYPYRVGFPAQKNADDGSIYHVNKELDTWGEYFGLKRRFYKENILEEDYPYTYPPYYPFDIEQDYWYYQRLINEYVYTEWAINDIDLTDTDDTPIVRLHSINPFVEDLVVHAKSVYPTNENGIRTINFIPNAVSQELVHDDDSEYRRSEYFNIQNLLKYDDNKTYITLRNKIGAGITYQQYMSKALKLFFDLKDLDPDIHIEDLQILVEAEATDNKDNKYSNEDTGFIIPGISETHIFPLQQDSIYELSEKEITYNLSSSIKDVLDYVNRIDSNIIHEIIIGKFGGKKRSYIQIPFTLKEHGEEIYDIIDVYVTFDGVKTVVGEYDYNDGYGYIKVFVPNATDFTTMSIACKTKDHNSFVAKDIPIINVEYTPSEDESKDKAFHAIYGPSANGAMTVESDDEMQLHTMVITDEWHTGDLRDILQKDGIYFVNVFQNDDETNTPTILLKNVTLKVSYSPKQTDFTLNTQVFYQVEKPAIAQLKVQIKNVGDKDLSTVVDVISATNLILSKNYFYVDLRKGDMHTEYIDITPEYPLIDGQYEILTVCEDKSYVNNILVFANGLIDTSVQLKDHYGTMGEEIVFTAKVNTITKQTIDEETGKISFYIDDHYIGDAFVNDNITSMTLSPNNKEYRYISSGLHTLEARFSGTTKYKSSRSYAHLSILRTDIIMDINDMPDEIVYSHKYNGQVHFYNIDNTPFMPENDNHKVSFYLDDILLGSKEIGNDGNVNFESDDIFVAPGTYTLTVNYHGNDYYIQQRQTKTISIVGGEVEIIANDIIAKPGDIKNIQVKIIDSINNLVNQGSVNFYLNNELLDTVEVHNGIAIMKNYTMPLVIDEYQLTIEYIDDTYISNSKTISLTIKRGEVIIHANNIFYASQYEPLGFYLNITDLDTNEAVTDGTVTIIIPDLGITAQGNIDDDGGVRIIHNIANFSSKDLRDLLAFNFFLHYDPDPNDIHNESLQRTQILSYTRDEESVLMDFDLTENKDLIYKYYQDPINTIETVDENNIVINDLPPGFEQVYIKDGHLFARINIDALRQYLTGTFDVYIRYESQNLYEDTEIKRILYLGEQTTNIDLTSYDLTYNEQNESISCYVSTYNINDDQYTPVNNSMVQFFIDNVKIGQSNILNGVAVIPPSSLKIIEYGNHLLQAAYVSEQNQENTYTYTSLKLNKIRSYIREADFITTLQGKKNQLDFTICVGDEYAIPIEGNIEVYLNDTKVLSDYLSDNQQYCVTKSYMIDIPADANINDYDLTIKYLGNQHIQESEYTFDIECHEINVEIFANDVNVAIGEKCRIDVQLTSKLNDFVNEGEIALYFANNEMVRTNVKNGKATLLWYHQQSVGDYLCQIRYINAEHYTDNQTEIYMHVIEPLNDIYIIQDNTYEDGNETFNDLDFYDDISNDLIYTDINEALQCLADNGTIHLVNKVVIANDINIDKNVNLLGHNNAQIIKDIGNLLDNNNSIQLYSDEFDQTIYEIVGLTSKYINDKDFCIIDNNLYYIGSNELIPIFLLNDGKFYSYQVMPLSSIIHNIGFINNAELNIKSIEFVTNDSDVINDFIIVNKGELSIIQSIINKNMNIVNYGIANINSNLVYGKLTNYGTMDKDNNWWGSNTISDDSINNHIIFTLWADTVPPVIGENIPISGQLIGANGFEYELPSVEFFFEAEDGFFSVDTGYSIDNYISTTYFDSTKEGKIYCTIDNETLSIDILDYDRETEVILEPMEIPIGYQADVIAKVRSCADYYYQNKIADNGYVTFYIYDNEAGDYKQIGKSIVQLGQATLSVYFSERQYPLGIQHNLSLLAVYTPDDYYFTSQNTSEIQLIDPQYVCYVSPQGKSDGDGSFDNPVQSIAQAISLDKSVIYLKEGIYEDTLIDVNSNVVLKKYYGDVIFKDNDEAIFTGNGTLTIDGLIFENNNQPITENIPNVNVDHCIFQNNPTTFLFTFSSGRTRATNVLNIDNSVLLNLKDTNTIVANDFSIDYNINCCWYGENLNKNIANDEKEKICGSFIPSSYIIMNLQTSKDMIYEGSVAKIIASLNKYADDDGEYDYNDVLPLRTAFFTTDIGSIMPSKDYTYNNQAVSFLNTNDENHNDDIIITFPDNTNYLYQNVKVKCYVHDIYGNDVDDILVNFVIKDSKDEIVRKIEATTNDGYAMVDTMALPYGSYTLTCYTKNGYQGIDNFNVVTPYINVTKCLLKGNKDFLHNMEMEIECVDPFGDKISSQKIDLYIDDTYIGYGVVENGSLRMELSYDNIAQGQHILKITTENYESDYEELNYYYSFNSYKKDTHIDFYDTQLVLSEPTDLIIYVYDNQKKVVKDGYVSIKFDGEEIDIIELQNGIAIKDDFQCDTEGQHFITIDYSGDNDYYNRCMLNKQINVGIEEVIITPKVIPFVADVGSSLQFNADVTDQSHRRIKRGTICVYINDVLLTNEEEQPIYANVENGEVQYYTMLPSHISAATNYTLKIKYHDPENKYIDTVYSSSLIVNPIATQILIDSVRAYTGMDQTIEYEGVWSAQGKVSSGILIAEYDGQEIGRSMVSGNNNSITLHIPKISAEETYEIRFKYMNDNEFYQNSETFVPLVLDKSEIQINALPTNYYPKQSFNLFAYCKDLQGQDLLNGELTLYVDNIKHSTQNIVNGRAIYTLKLNTVKDYALSFIYEEDDYYLRTLKEQRFIVNNIPITNIDIDVFESQPNTSQEIELTFDTENDLKVNDGYVDIYFDDSKINTYSITESENKYVKINIPDVDAGDYVLRIKYYDSSVFSDYIQEYDFTVTKIPITIEVEDVTAEMNEEILIKATFTNKISGVLEYSLQTNNGAIRFIGIESIINQKEHSYSYTLPDDLEDTQYSIVVKYMGDGQHDQEIGIGTLYINKLNIEISNIIINDILYENNVSYDIEYQNSLSLSFDTNVQNRHNFDIYLNDNLIGVIPSVNGVASLDEDFIIDVDVGIYQLTIHSDPSVVFNEHVSENIEINVIATDPLFADLNDEECYIGGYATLPHQVRDNNNIDIDGEFTYEINGQALENIQNNKVILNEINDVIVNVSFVPNNNNFNTINDNVTFTMKKNNVNVDISDIDNVYRGQTGIPLNIIFNSNTTTNLLYPRFTLRIEDQSVEYINNKIDMPLNLTDNDQYTLYIESEGNDVFNPIDAQFILKNKNIDTVTVRNAEMSYNVVNDLEQAFDLVADLGTIVIERNINGGDCVNNKQVNIIGNNYNLINCTIQNEGILTISNLTFKENDDSAIYTNNKLYLDNCTFISNEAQYGAAIYIDSKNQDTEIINCTFNDNNASLYGGAIFSNKGNDVIIQNSVFTASNSAGRHGSSISTNGNMSIKENIFCNNIANDEIYIMNGSVNIEDNYFDAKITSVNNLNGNVTANFNYWGCNDISYIDESSYKGTIIFDTWLYSDYDIRYTELSLNNIHKHITCFINKYKDRTNPEITEYKKLFEDYAIVEFENNYYNLYDEIETIMEHPTIIIGKQEYQI